MRNILLASLLLVLALTFHNLFAADAPRTQPGPAAAAPMKTQYWFGVAVENLPPAFAKQLKLNPDQGLMVLSILPNSPAQNAQLQPEDILLEINGHPLTSQNDLFLAANPSAVGPSALPKASKLTFLRSGERTTVDILPAQRPANMIVYGETNKDRKIVNNYVSPNGGGAQIGMGMRVDLSSNPGSLTARSIKRIVSEGQTIILSQETDTQGNVKNTITVGATSHVVDPNHLDALPAELRPFAEQLIAGTPAQVHPDASSAPATTRSIEERLNQLESENKILHSENAQLKNQVQALQKNK